MRCFSNRVAYSPLKAELMFLKALECESDVVPKALMNLGLVYNTRGSFLAQTGDMPGAKMAALDAEKYIDAAKPLLDQLAASGNADSDMFSYIRQYRPLRLQCHRLLGQLHAGAGDMAASEAEFRRATQNFPDERNAWQMLGRVLEVQGKTEEMQSVIEKIKALNLPQ
jgi:tetratricopeptide (TPR) repeat protein